MSRRPAVLILVGVAVFLAGASLVMVGLHPKAASGSTRARVSASSTGGSGGALPAAPSEVSVAAGHQAVAVAPASGAAGMAAYLGPGDLVDVYASITKLSTMQSSTGAPVPVPNRPVPCTVLVAANVPVIDVSVQAPEYATHPSSAGRTIPTSVTVLLSATTAQAPAIVFAAGNESVYLTETSGPNAPAPAGSCFDTASALSGAAS